MDHHSLQKYKTKLETEREKLLGEVSKEEKPTEFGDQQKPDIEEEADETEEFINQLAVAHDLKRRVDEIDVALSKINNGTFGSCEKCRNEIEPDVLDVDPESRLCKRCKLQK